MYSGDNDNKHDSSTHDKKANRDPIRDRDSCIYIIARATSKNVAKRIVCTHIHLLKWIAYLTVLCTIGCSI